MFDSVYLSLKSGFYRLQNAKLVQYENALLTRTLSMTLRIRAKVLLRVWSYDYPLNKSDVM